MVLVRLGPLRAGPWAPAAWPAGAPPLLIAALPIVLVAALFTLGHRLC